MKRRLLVIGPVPPPIHGESLAIRHLAGSEMTREKFQVTVVNTNRKRVNGGGKFSFIKIFQDIAIMIRIRRIAGKGQADIVYLSISQTKLGLLRDALIIFLIAGKTDQIVAHLHGNHLKNVLESFHRIPAGFIFHMMRKIDTGIVLSRGLSANFMNLPRRIEVIANGIEKDFIRTQEIASFSKVKSGEGHCFTLLYLSNLIEAKGFGHLILAVVDLLRQQLNVRLLLAGQIYDRKRFDQLMAQVAGEQFDSRIRYLGTVTGVKKKQLLLRSDAMVLPTRYRIEGQPISIIEGMAAGLPIISSAQGAIPELIEGSGIVLDTVDRSSIAAAIRSLITDKALYKKYALNGRKTFLEKYTMDRYIDGLISVFEGGGADEEKDLIHRQLFLS
ncbi:glycosyltransferase family 4 protein [Sporolactobacillus sp. CQH2019]|uniref:glycosyltransferase family 4 protein n=1 Tax=Sporolactobacillus sp. CQH2019 TaxID=3023512 RepID=UPI0023678234|nr:glycosyltransferase family 4 protein [Sporolactobacillus sp. CQH2019]MDD9148992.1 glycosyltransferase family 4 protein [Sporolactobacillus sp. CQH2019]